ncbi:MAG: hypothetical protein RI907_598 [Pseudomonadota bacterium]|jgi:hypothetical protein
MPIRPDSPDPTGTAGATANPFATLGEELGKGLDFFQDWVKAAGSALPHVSGANPATGAMPGWSLPTLDPAELDKRIQELRTVQFWLEQNARMIAMTIQGLEVQRMTLSTLQGMNVSMDQLKDALKVKPDAMQAMFTRASTPSKAEPAAAAAPPAAPSAAPTAAPPAEPAAPPEAPRPSSRWFQGVPDEPEPAEEDTATSDDEVRARMASGNDKPQADASDLINPMRWWDTLTQQFSHLTAQAAAPVATPTPPPAAQARAAAKPAPTVKASPAGKRTKAAAPRSAPARKGRAGKNQGGA